MSMWCGGAVSTASAVHH